MATSTSEQNCGNCKNNKGGLCTVYEAIVESIMSCVRGYKKK